MAVKPKKKNDLLHYFSLVCRVSIVTVAQWVKHCDSRIIGLSPDNTYNAV